MIKCPDITTYFSCHWYYVDMSKNRYLKRRYDIAIISISAIFHCIFDISTLS